MLAECLLNIKQQSTDSHQNQPMLAECLLNIKKLFTTMQYQLILAKCLLHGRQN